RAAATDSDAVHPMKELPHTGHTSSIDFDMADGTDRGDYSWMCVVTKHKACEITYVVDAYGDRIKGDASIEIVVDKVLEWQPDVVAVESVAAQEFFADVLKAELANAGYPAYTRLKKIYSRSRKELRIEAMLPIIENESLQFSRKHSLLLE